MHIGIFIGQPLSNLANETHTTAMADPAWGIWGTWPLLFIEELAKVAVYLLMNC